MRRFARLAGEAGASLMEYALLVSLIAVVCIASIQAFRGETTKIFVNVASQLP
jgi:Flp pilus assembly pilin Flp